MTVVRVAANRDGGKGHDAERAASDWTGRRLPDPGCSNRSGAATTHSTHTASAAEKAEPTPISAKAETEAKPAPKPISKAEAHRLAVQAAKAILLKPVAMAEGQYYGHMRDCGLMGIKEYFPIMMGIGGKEAPDFDRTELRTLFGAGRVRVKKLPCDLVTLTALKQVADQERADFNRAVRHQH